jgi:Cysteine-rich CWC
MVPCGMNTQTCESCGREFACGADEETCWCNALTLAPEHLAILREHFERCLCPDCLRVTMHDPMHSG